MQRLPTAVITVIMVRSVPAINLVKPNLLFTPMSTENGPDMAHIRLDENSLRVRSWTMEVQIHCIAVSVHLLSMPSSPMIVFLSPKWKECGLHKYKVKNESIYKCIKTSTNVKKQTMIRALLHANIQEFKKRIVFILTLLYVEHLQDECFSFLLYKTGTLQWHLF